MSSLSDKRAICRFFAGSDERFTFFEDEQTQYIAGSFGTLTPVCAIYFRKAGEEYRIDYDQFLTVWRDEEVSLETLKARLRSGDYLWKHNVYPGSFTLNTLTVEKRPSRALVDRIQAFLLDHAKARKDALPFAQSGDSKFLNDCRRFRPDEYEERLLAKLI